MATKQKDTTEQTDTVKTGDFLPALRELKPFDEIELELATLRAKNAVLFNYNDPKDNAAARSHVHSMRLVKGRLERQRKAVKADALEFGRRIDAEAGRIEAELDALIEVHATKLKELEEREAQRKAGHEATLHNLEKLSIIPHGTLVSGIAHALQLARDFVVDGSLDEYQERAATIKTGTIAILEDMLAQAKQREEEQAELARLRQEKEEREQREREAEEQRQREEQARKDREAEEQRERERKAEQEHAEQERQRQAEENRKENHRRGIRAIEDVGVGLINGRPAAFGLLWHELDELVERDFEDFQEAANEAAGNARSNLKALEEQEQRRQEQEAENQRLRNEAAANQRREQLRGKISLFRHFMPTETDVEQTIASKQSRLLKPTASEYGDLLDEATAAWQIAFDALKAKREEFTKARQAAEERAAQEKREASKRHRNKIHNAAAAAILEAMTNAPDPDAIAHAIVEAIAEGKIPAVKIEY